MIDNYCKEYMELIFNAIEHMIVTDADGNEITMDEGMDVWAEKARYVQTETKGLIFFCGNGASASMAEHMSHDWFQNGEINTTTCSEVAHVTAIANDCGYDDVFSFRVKRIISDKDIVVGISSSGNSKNIINALEAAKENGAFTISLSGKKEDNTIRKIGDLNFYVPLETYGEVESAHAVILHCALDYFMDKYLKGRH